MNLRYGGGPADWIAKHGKPARCLGSRGMPSYEHENGKLLVFDFMVLQQTPYSLLAFPRSYGWVSLVAPEGLAPLHLRVEEGTAHEWWEWRPLIYHWHADGWWQGMGSQQELGYRFGLSEVQHEVHGEPGEGDIERLARGEMVAERLMLTQLSYQQTIEFRATGKFRVIGARTGNLYRVTPSNGFELIDAYTGKIVVSYCLHTEHWLPSCDQALAIKMALEDRELEVDVLENAKPYPRTARRRVTMSDRVALRLEREHRLLPEHRELVGGNY